MKYISGFIAIICMAVCMTPAAQAQSEQKREYVGRAESVREAGMIFWRLVNHADEEIELLGAPYEFQDGNKKAADCIELSIEKDKQIRITGVWKRDRDAWLLDASTAVCVPVNSPKDCPDKVMGTITRTGINAGVECGEDCFITLQLANGKEFSAYAEVDVAQKLFGMETGNKVSAEFEMRQMWKEDDGIDDGRPDEGWCEISPVLKAGKVLTK